MHELIVGPTAASERLDVFLANQLHTTRSQAQRWLRQGQVQVNRAAERASYLVVAGDQISVKEAATPPAVRPTPTLPVLYEDQDLLVIDKPPGMAVHAGAGIPDTEATVADFARPRTTDPDPERPGIVHRLDRDTSGLMIIAKTTAAKDYLQQQFRTRSVHKTYLALTIGRPHPEAAVISLPLDRHPSRPLRRAVVRGGRPAVTHYRTLAVYAGYSLLEVKPETGRTHQIRVHFAALGHPVAGDTTYGPPQRALGLARQFLHATHLRFTTPTGKELSLDSPLPPDLKSVIQTLEKAV